MRVWVLACLMAVTAIAGCVEEEPEPEAETDDIMMGANPGASLAADATAGEAPTTIFVEFDVFEVPLESVNWMLDMDADGAPETEGPGSALPGNFSFTYENAGDYNATFTATDGTSNWTSTVAISITEPVEEEPAPDDNVTDEPAAPTFPVVVSGELAASNANFYNGAEFGPHLFCDGWSTSSGLVGGECAWFEIQPEWIGRSFSTAAAGDLDVWIGDSCASQTAQSTYVGGESGNDSGSIPEGSGCFALANFEGDGEWTVTIR